MQEDIQPAAHSAMEGQTAALRATGAPCPGQPLHPRRLGSHHHCHGPQIERQPLISRHRRPGHDVKRHPPTALSSPPAGHLVPVRPAPPPPSLRNAHPLYIFHPTPPAVDYVRHHHPTPSTLPGVISVKQHRRSFRPGPLTFTGLSAARPLGTAPPPPSASGAMIAVVALPTTPPTPPDVPPPPPVATGGCLHTHTCTHTHTHTHTHTPHGRLHARSRCHHPHRGMQPPTSALYSAALASASTCTTATAWAWALPTCRVTTPAGRQRRLHLTDGNNTSSHRNDDH